MARDRLATRIHRGGARMYITQRGSENGWKNKVAYRGRDKSFVNLQNDWMVVVCDVKIIYKIDLTFKQRDY